MHHYGVTRADVGKQSLQLWAVGVAAAALVGKGAIESHAVELAGGVLAYRTDPDVRDSFTGCHRVPLQ